MLECLVVELSAIREDMSESVVLGLEAHETPLLLRGALCAPRIPFRSTQAFVGESDVSLGKCKAS